MNSQPVQNLRPYKPRTFVPGKFNAGEWTEIEPLFDRLEVEIATARTAADLEQWLLNWSELAAALEEEGAIRYIRMTCNTEDPEAEKAYLHFVETIDPQLKPRRFKLCEHYTRHPARKDLDPGRYLVLDRDLALTVELFRPENVPLETEDARLCQQYEKLSGSLTVIFKGKERTLPQMSLFLEETDRAVRQEAWESVARRRLQDRDKFDDLFDRMVELRTQMALNAGFKNYRDYMFRRMGRFDYTPEHCFNFHNAVETEVLPALRRVQQDRKRKLGLSELRPWDTEVDPDNKPPLRPFENVEDMVEKTARIFQKVDPALARDFDVLRGGGLLDLANRKGKAPGGYQSNLTEARVPFIFMNAVGVQRDVETLLHEGGHAFHALATQNEDLHAYRNPPIEFCEVASMTMELLGNEFAGEFYTPEEARRARKTHLQNVLKTLSWIATVDAFQHWIYTNPNHSREERRNQWSSLMRRFAGDIDYAGYEKELANLWHRQLHIFTHPFYYIEYGIAQLGALQVWANSRENGPEALAAYKRALALGGARPLPELFETAGCKFRFDRATIAPLVRMLEESIKPEGSSGKRPVFDSPGAALDLG